MKKIFFIIALLASIQTSAQIKFVREVNLEGQITDISTHVYSIYSCIDNLNVIAWNIKIISNQEIHSIACSPTGGYLANSTGSFIQVWKIDDKSSLVKTIKTHHKLINTICFSSQGYLASAGEDMEIHVYDVKQNKLLANLKSENGAIQVLSYNSTGNIIYSANQDSTISIWNLRELKQEKTIRINSEITSMCISSDDALIVVGTSSGFVKIIDSNTGNIKYDILGHAGRVNSVAINQNNFYVASAGDDNKIVFWALKNGAVYKSLEDNIAPVSKVIFSYDFDQRREFFFAGGQDKLLRVWEVTDLPLPLEYLIKKEIQEQIEQWEQKREGESILLYQNRISQENKKKQVNKIQDSIVNKYALRVYPLIDSQLSAYDTGKETYTITYDQKCAIALKIPKNEAENFSKNFKSLKPQVFQFVFDNDDFKLNYLELKDTLNQKTFYYDESGIKNNELYRVEEIVAPPIEVLVEVANKQDTLKEKLNTYIGIKKEEKIISDNVKLSVNTKITVEKDSIGKPELNYHIEYSYEVIKATVENQTDDFPLGKYKLTSSNAAKITVQILKETIDKELIKYIKSGMDVTIKITGSTDASPVVNTIPYSGDFKDFEDEPYFFNNNLESMTVSQKTGITKNEQLAFLRTYGVRDFITNYIESLNSAKLHFQHYTYVAKEKGSQYRRISIELILHGVFSEFRNNPKVQTNKSASMEDVHEYNSDTDENIPAGGVVNDKIFAVVIGNENYSKEIKVGFALNDSRIFKQYLQKTIGIPYNNIHYIEDGTYGQILDALKWIGDVSKAYLGQVKIIFYYAGHGMPDEQSKSAFLLPVDGNSRNTASAIKLSEIYSKLTETPSISVTVFLDACFSGATREVNETMLSEGRGVKIKPINDVLPGNVVVISAATGDETAFPLPEKNHGLFTYFLLKKLQESKGTASLNEIYDYIRTNVMQQSVLVNKKSQTPQVNTGLVVQDTWQKTTFK